VGNYLIFNAIYFGVLRDEKKVHIFKILILLDNKMQFFGKKNIKYLVMWNKSSTFAPKSALRRSVSC
jgi:hypothetical protein